MTKVAHWTQNIHFRIGYKLFHKWISVHTHTPHIRSTQHTFKASCTVVYFTNFCLKILKHCLPSHVRSSTEHEHNWPSELIHADKQQAPPHVFGSAFIAAWRAEQGSGLEEQATGDVVHEDIAYWGVEVTLCAI
jgi:hypothetical protein